MEPTPYSQAAEKKKKKKNYKKKIIYKYLTLIKQHGKNIKKLSYMAKVISIRLTF